MAAPLKTSYKIPLSSLEVTVPGDSGNYSGERALDFSIISPVRSCTFRAATPAERDAWVAAMRKAVREHHDRRATFANAATMEKVQSNLEFRSSEKSLLDRRPTFLLVRLWKC